VKTRGSRTRVGALALYATLTFVSFPHEGPSDFTFDLGLLCVWFVPAALIVGFEGLSPGRAALFAFLASIAAHSAIFHWFIVVTVQYGGMPAWLGLFSPLVPALYVSLFTALFAWTWTRYGRTARWPILSGAMSWVAIDWLRGHFLGGFPWATLGYALHLDAVLLGWTRWAGVYALSFFAAILGVAMARVVLKPGAETTRAFAYVLGFVLAAHGVGLWISQDDFESSEVVRIAAVQGNIDQGEKWDAERRDQILDGYLRLSREAIDQGASWVVWPETAVPGLLEVDATLQSQMSVLARDHGISLIVGGAGVEFDPSSRRLSSFFDSAFLIDSKGDLQDRYDKSHLVPFGEYVPLRAFFGRFFQSLARGLSTTDITPGPGPRTLSIGTPSGGSEMLQVGVPICYELLFPHVVRQFGADGAGVLLAMTNDAWYGRTGAPHQFLAMTAIRAAENGRWVVRAANTGISAIIDARGRVREASPLFEEAVLVADVPVATQLSRTFYARFGDVFAWICIFGTVLLVGHKELAERTQLRRERIETNE
jgi:apolipoprotein N-acyltransferase